MLRTSSIAFFAFAFIAGCAAPTPNITLVGTTMGYGREGHEELTGNKSASLRKKLLNAIDSGQFGINDWVPIDTNDPNSTVTALCAATSSGNVETIRELLRRGANPNQACVPGGKKFALDVMVERRPESSWNHDETINVLRSYGAKLAKQENQKTLDQDLARMNAEETARRSAKSSSGGFGKLVVGAGIAALTSQANISDESKVQIMSATAQDLASNGNGKALSNLNDSISPPRTTTPIAQGSNSNTAPDTSWRQCGPGKKCLIGDGVAQFCSGPYDPSKPMCKSECSMDSLAFYHDTTLKPGAYIPGAGRCPSGSCNVVNSCN